MRCFVEIIDGKVSGYTMCEPMIESDFRLAFPDVDVGILPSWIEIPDIEESVNE